ncbi:hypothetical protein [Streptomyces globisporus]
MTQMSRHGRTAREFWQTYRPRALEELGSPEEQEEFFVALDLRVTEQIGQTANELLQQLPMEQRGPGRRAVKAQAQELVYADLVWLEKEPGTEHREM